MESAGSAGVACHGVIEPQWIVAVRRQGRLTILLDDPGKESSPGSEVPDVLEELKMGDAFLTRVSGSRRAEQTGQTPAPLCGSTAAFQGQIGPPLTRFGGEEQMEAESGPSSWKTHPNRCKKDWVSTIYLMWS